MCILGLSNQGESSLAKIISSIFKIMTLLIDGLDKNYKEIARVEIWMKILNSLFLWLMGILIIAHVLFVLLLWSEVHDFETLAIWWITILVCQGLALVVYGSLHHSWLAQVIAFNDHLFQQVISYLSKTWLARNIAANHATIDNHKEE